MFSEFTMNNMAGWLADPCIEFVKNNRSVCMSHLAYVKAYLCIGILDDLSLIV